MTISFMSQPEDEKHFLLFLPAWHFIMRKGVLQTAEVTLVVAIFQTYSTHRKRPKPSTDNIFSES